MKKLLLLIAMVLAVALALPMTALFVSADPPPDNQPTYDTAVVDGDYGEWDLADDFFADMYEAGKPDGSKPVMSKLYLRYDCDKELLYVLVLVVLVEDGYYGLRDAAQAWIKVYDIQQNPLPWLVEGGFAWVEMAPPETAVRGYEACTSLAPGSYDEIEVHIQIVPDSTSSTGKQPDRIPLVLVCDNGGGVTEEVGGEVYAIDMTSGDSGNSWALWLVGSSLILAVGGGILALRYRRAH